MAYVAIDTQGARALGKVLIDTAVQAEWLRRETVAALKLSDLSSQTPVQLGLVQDGMAALGTGIAGKADLAEQFTVDPQRVSASLGVEAGQLRTAIADLIGFAGAPRSLRGAFVGLPPAGADVALDNALARLDQVLLPALRSGQTPQFTAGQLEDLRVLAVALGISGAGPRTEYTPPDGEASGFLRRSSGGRTEVFWHDFWSDGRNVEEVLASPEQLFAWVAGTYELDQRLAHAAELPKPADMLATHDFATAGTDGADLAQLLAAADVEFAPIATWLPAFLVGRDRTPPQPAQVELTLAFARRVGWFDPAPGVDAFADAVAYLRGNRVVQSALLPTAFEGDTEPLAFFNEPGIGHMLALGRASGVIDDAFLAGIAGPLDQILAAAGAAGPTGAPGATGTAPVELSASLQQQLFALVATQLPTAMVRSPAIQAQFIAALGFLKQATTADEQRQRMRSVVAAFRTLAVTGPPALTERQLTDIVGGQIVGVLGRGRLRLRDEAAWKKSPEFYLVVRQWGIPGGQKQEIGKYKFSWSFDEFGQLVSIRRKKKSWLSRAFDTIKSIGKAIWQSWEDNPFKAIFQIGKIALTALAAIAVPGLGAAALALNLAEGVYHAVEGDWLAALGSGLAAFTAGADIFGDTTRTALEVAQAATVKDLLGDTGALSLLANAKRAFDVGTSVFAAVNARSPLEAITAGLGAAATGLVAGPPVLRDLGLLTPTDAKELAALGLTVRDIGKVVVPAVGVVNAVDKGVPLDILGNGLLVISAGAKALGNRSGVLPGALGFTTEDVKDLTDIAKLGGVSGMVARAVSEADKGNVFLTGSLLAQAVQAINDPRTTVIGNRAVAAARVADIGAALELVFKGANPRAAAPVVLDRLGKAVDALATPVVTTATGGLTTDSATKLSATANASVFAETRNAGAFADAGAADETMEVSAFGEQRLAGGPADNTLFGASGNDTVIGGGSGDELSAVDGQADDLFTFAAAGATTARGPVARSFFSPTLDGTGIVTGEQPNVPLPAFGLPIAVPPLEPIDLVRLRQQSIPFEWGADYLTSLGARTPPTEGGGLKGARGGKGGGNAGIEVKNTVLPDGGTEYEITQRMGLFRDTFVGKARLGLEVGVSRTTPPGQAVPDRMLPVDLGQLGVGESVVLTANGALSGTAKLILKGGAGYETGRVVEITRDGEGFVVTVFDEDKSEFSVGGTVKVVGGSLGRSATTQVGERYFVSSDPQQLTEGVHELLVHGGSTERPPDEMVVRRTVAYPISGELFGFEGTQSFPWVQEEVYGPAGGTGKVQYLDSVVDYRIDGGVVRHPVLSSPTVPGLYVELDPANPSKEAGQPSGPWFEPDQYKVDMVRDTGALILEKTRPLAGFLPQSGITVIRDEQGVPVDNSVDVRVGGRSFTVTTSALEQWRDHGPLPTYLSDADAARWMSPGQIAEVPRGVRGLYLQLAFTAAASTMGGVDFGNLSDDLLPRRPAGGEQVTAAAGPGTSVSFPDAPFPPLTGTVVTPVADQTISSDPALHDLMHVVQQTGGSSFVFPDTSADQLPFESLPSFEIPSFGEHPSFDDPVMFDGVPTFESVPSFEDTSPFENMPSFTESPSFGDDPFADMEMFNYDEQSTFDPSDYELF